MELPVAVLNCKPVFGIKTMIVVYKGIHIIATTKRFI